MIVPAQVSWVFATATLAALQVLHMNVVQYWYIRGRSICKMTFRRQYLSSLLMNIFPGLKFDRT